MAFPVSAVVGILDKGAQIAIEVLKKKNTEENRKYIDAYYDAHKKLNEELAKSLDKQYDNVVEEYTKSLELLQDVAIMDMKNGGE